MGIFSDNTRLKVAFLVKLVLIINIILFAILGIFEYVDTVTDLLPACLGFVISYMVYQKLLDTKDGGWRTVAEIFGSVQILANAAFIIILVWFILFGV